MAKKRIITYLLILALALVIGIPLCPVFYAIAYEQASFANAFLRTRPRYVYFGDSVLTVSSSCEANHRAIMELLPKEIAKKTFAFNGGAENADLWRATARFIAAHNDGAVSAAIIPINMGVFAAGWEHNPRYHFEQGRMFYTLKSGQLSMAEYLRLAWDVFSEDYRYRRDVKVEQDSPVMVGQQSIGRYLDVSNAYSKLPIIPCHVDLNQLAKSPDAKLLGLRFAEGYGTAILASDPYFSYLDETVERLRQAHIRPILYITPLDMEDIKRFGGDAVRAQLDSNLALVRRIARQKNWELIDLSATLPSEHFITRECACEHVDGVGRGFIAQQVAIALERDL